MLLSSWKGRLGERSRNTINFLLIFRKMSWKELQLSWNYFSIPGGDITQRSKQYFFFCNRYDCIQKHWLIVYCNCFILKWWHFPIVCKYLWIWGISCCLCWGLHEFVTKQSELPVRSSRCPSTALLLSQIRLLSNITDTSLKFHGVPSNIVQYNPTLPNTIQCNKHFAQIPLNTGRHYSLKGRSSCSQQINSTVQSFNLATNDYNIMQLA